MRLRLTEFRTGCFSGAMTVSSLVKDLDGRDVSTSGRYSNFTVQHFSFGVPK